MKSPFFRQLDVMDCGPSCLRMIEKHYGRSFSVQQLNEKSYIMRTGVNLMGLSEVAESIGFRLTAVRTSIKKLKVQAKLPYIIHWKQELFVVLFKITQQKGKCFFHIADPAYGILNYEEQEFKNCWISTVEGGFEKGVAMFLETTAKFYEAEAIQYESISLWLLLKYVKPYRAMVKQLIIGLFLGSLLQLVFPFLTQSIVDQGNRASKPEFYPIDFISSIGIDHQSHGSRSDSAYYLIIYCRYTRKRVSDFRLPDQIDKTAHEFS